MRKHRGHMLEIAVRESGKPLSEISKKLGITRSTLYKKFQMTDINTSVFIDVGRAIDYDFSLILPDIETVVSNNWSEEKSKFLSNMSNFEKNILYENLLNRFRKLLKMLLKASLSYKNENINEKIEYFITKNLI